MSDHPLCASTGSGIVSPNPRGRARGDKEHALYHNPLLYRVECHSLYVHVRVLQRSSVML